MKGDGGLKRLAAAIEAGVGLSGGVPLSAEGFADNGEADAPMGDVVAVTAADAGGTLQGEVVVSEDAGDEGAFTAGADFECAAEAEVVLRVVEKLEIAGFGVDLKAMAFEFEDNFDVVGLGALLHAMGDFVGVIFALEAFDEAIETVLHEALAHFEVGHALNFENLLGRDGGLLGVAEFDGLDDVLAVDVQVGLLGTTDDLQEAGQDGEAQGPGHVDGTRHCWIRLQFACQSLSL